MEIPVRELWLEIGSTPEEVSQAVRDLGDFVGVLGFRSDRIHDMCLAVEEALVNVALHGHRETPSGRMEISASVDDAGAMVIIRDGAPAFNPLEVPTPDLEVPLEQRTVGGLGVHLIRNLVHKVQYERVEGQNILTLTWFRSRWPE